MRHKSFLFNNAIINYQDEGQGDKTIVLLHGFMNTLDVWATYAFKYMKSMRVVAVDLLGHGESGSIADCHTMEMQAEMVKALLDHLKVENCVIIGHSMGGYVALCFADEYPDFVKGMGLVNSHALEDGKDAKENRLRVCDVVRANRASFIINFIPDLFAKENLEALSFEIKDIQDRAICMSVESIVAAQKGMLARPTRLKVLIDSKFPILFIAGKKDSRIVIESLCAQAMLPHHSEIMILDNVGHMAHIEADMLVKDRLSSFCQMCYSI
ncbi:MAG: catD 1 [Bacteroidetes bacterium]|nr:catD 1 [Bacteroidota bacterium]